MDHIEKVNDIYKSDDLKKDNNNLNNVKNKMMLILIH